MPPPCQHNLCNNVQQAANARLELHLDDMSIIGKLTPAAGAFRRLCMDDDGVRSIRLEPRLRKCGV